MTPIAGVKIPVLASRHPTPAHLFSPTPFPGSVGPGARKLNESQGCRRHKHRPPCNVREARTGILRWPCYQGETGSNDRCSKADGDDPSFPVGRRSAVTVSLGFEPIIRHVPIL